MTTKLHVETNHRVELCVVSHGNADAESGVEMVEVKGGEMSQILVSGQTAIVGEKSERKFAIVDMDESKPPEQRVLPPMTAVECLTALAGMMRTGKFFKVMVDGREAGASGGGG